MNHTDQPELVDPKTIFDPVFAAALAEYNNQIRRHDIWWDEAGFCHYPAELRVSAGVRQFVGQHVMD